MPAHIHGSIYKERGLLTAEENTVKNKQEILNLLQALWEPTKLTHTRLRTHAEGNNLADRTAKEIATATRVTPVLIDTGERNLLQIPKYTPEDLAWIHTLPMAQPLEDGGKQLIGRSSCQGS